MVYSVDMYAINVTFRESITNHRAVFVHSYCDMKVIIVLFSLLAVSLSGRIWGPADFNPLSDEFIEFLNEDQFSWKAGRNFPEDVQLEQLRKLCGYKQEKDDYSLQLKVNNEDMDIPPEFDGRKYWSNCPSLREIRNQGNCGSCWAFAATEAMTDRICIKSKGKHQFHLSAENLLSCCETCGNGCNGGNPHKAWQYFEEKGIVTGWGFHSHKGCQPYTIPSIIGHPEFPTPSCEHRCETGYNETYAQDKHFGISSYAIPKDVSQIQTEIMKNGPVEVGFQVYADFFHYKSGVYINHVKGISHGHAVKIIGWGEENGVPYWLIANSWGNKWGDNGLEIGNAGLKTEAKVNEGLYTINEVIKL
ncbi:Cathepsin B [Nymphon striatum]|nr:Cathepsin B [Nymphon striatum]